ncbi:hypothetical protein M406DRAFT_281772 [Cryphonectria parasitica EP155]|uniref:Complex 1 LYR protein domain-containing protein n=1 Tax=Cryphonectria parasitica (strain ATCC 38755 / EP155) TaxID=660469 RepID=A0A9P4XVT6_CRYP1|nr:uncharacterized protein M406DRAFT_281772 [Cryphonectria parasitica EP155]KAF3761695.1 hypothetical protein M406DRAFT_281772 [Cryphonectria parasitica EP155]
MPSFFVPARDSRHRAACFALYRALLRLVPKVTLPDDLFSRPDWQHPIRYLLRTSFQRNKNDTSPRLVTSALKSGYRSLTLLTRARDASSPQHAEIVAFLRERQAAFPPPKPPPPQPEPPKRERPPPLLTRTSSPHEMPVYTSTVRPLPLSEISGGVRKVPVLDETNSIAFLRIGKPQSHWHANFLRRKALRRQARITTVQEMWEDVRPSAAEEDAWERRLEELAAEEGTFVLGPYERTVREYGVEYLRKALNDEAEDMVARSTAMLDIVDEERKLAAQERLARKEERRKDWEERTRQEKEQAQQQE